CIQLRHFHSLFSFLFNDTATTDIYTLSLHDALPICFPEAATDQSKVASLLLRFVILIICPFFSNRKNDDQIHKTVQSFFLVIYQTTQPADYRQPAMTIPTCSLEYSTFDNSSPYLPTRQMLPPK